MSGTIVALLLFAVGGFLAGGAFSTWKNNSRPAAVALAVAALIAVGGAVAWLSG